MPVCLQLHNYERRVSKVPVGRIGVSVYHNIYLQISTGIKNAIAACRYAVPVNPIESQMLAFFFFFSPCISLYFKVFCSLFIPLHFIYKSCQGHNMGQHERLHRVVRTIS